MASYNNTHKLPTESYGDIKTSILIVPTSLPPHLLNLITLEEYLEIIHQFKTFLEKRPSKFLKFLTIFGVTVLLCFFIPLTISLCLDSKIGIWVGAAVAGSLLILFITLLVRMANKMEADLVNYFNGINARYYSKGFSFFREIKVYGAGKNAKKVTNIFVRIYHPDLPLPTPPPQYLSYQNTQSSPQNLASDNFEPYVDEKTLIKNF
ncbi:hypothetical protein DICPUDRAFT_147439 [Dictyostelium purpureum]|uniref:Uncharacterized protein n=1 Tax=Dictyostelium purpureum TaxID=5786 RepID=F0Z8H4_DICPU|nr:uncharacterized protein DICPUDRAFT_147439 [Dictyostelium purpureum]EGC39728.1 hypothetical protein DICPUDRAFT_147439 [Dictyostelium purpureum]|eukprot:XP_003283714.1 hypothetical protein DICPUDRAFT_147439 [Dictyostelium purpureum]